MENFVLNKTAKEIVKFYDGIILNVQATEHDLKTLLYDDEIVSIVCKIEITKNIINRFTNILEKLVTLKVNKENKENEN